MRYCLITSRSTDLLMYREIQPTWLILPSDFSCYLDFLTDVDVIVVDTDAIAEDAENFLATVKSSVGSAKGVIAVARRKFDPSVKSLIESGVDLVIGDESPKVFSAHLRAVVRRASNPLPHDLIRFQTLTLDFSTFRAYLTGLEISLTKTEFELLGILARSANQIVSRVTFYDRVFKTNSDTCRALDVHLCHLRRKLRGSDISIESVRSLGYRLVREVREQPMEKLQN
ncbi:MAG: response regulator transcription factor [Proteobacteria bacterium]|nr:MAG: response regulator transcription factor [Pseudomonadota bacterium]